MQSGRDYLAALGEITRDDWPTLIRLAADEISETGSNPRHFALLHPEFLVLHFSTELSASIRGSMTFPNEMPLGNSCESSVIWGYECPVTQSDIQHSDHVFPFSLGGRTEPTNRLRLCDRHNLFKTNDIHLYPDWYSCPDWLLTAISVRRSALEIYPGASSAPK